MVWLHNMSWRICHYNYKDTEWCSYFHKHFRKKSESYMYVWKAWKFQHMPHLHITLCQESLMKLCPMLATRYSNIFFCLPWKNAWGDILNLSCSTSSVICWSPPRWVYVNALLSPRLQKKNNWSVTNKNKKNHQLLKSWCCHYMLCISIKLWINIMLMGHAFLLKLMGNMQIKFYCADSCSAIS